MLVTTQNQHWPPPRPWMQEDVPASAASHRTGASRVPPITTPSVIRPYAELLQDQDEKGSMFTIRGRIYLLTPYVETYLIESGSSQIVRLALEVLNTVSPNPRQSPGAQGAG